jgi:hypothetical protein
LPATSTESLMSWGVYLLAAGGILIVLMPTVTTVGSMSSAAMAKGEVQGVADVLDSLRPGMTVVFTAGPGAGITLAGHEISEKTSAGVFNASCTWGLPYLQLAPGGTYSARLSGGSVLVVPHGTG